MTKVLTSPLQRAARTCELAGFGTVAEIDLTLSNGSTANMRDFARPRSTRSARIGNCSATAVPEASRRIAPAGLLARGVEIEMKPTPAAWTPIATLE